MKVGILGHFGLGKTMLNGQTVKTKMLADGIQKYTDIKVIKLDSHNWIKKPLKLYRNIKTAFRECDAIVMLPAENGVRIFAPLLLCFKKKYRKKIFYDVIGGWLPEFLNKNENLSNSLKQFDGVWVETNTMRNKLLNQGFDNVVVIPNFKELHPLSESELVYPTGIPYRLCTFSRVMKEKGIEDAIAAVKAVNEELGFTAFLLDIYGQVWNEYKECFAEVERKFPDFIRYVGAVDADKSVDTLKGYFALLFPTYYEGEGFAGTLIDAYFAGIPIIATDWRYNAELISEKTGIVYQTRNHDAFVKILKEIVMNPTLILNKKKCCIAEAYKYQSQFVMSLIIEQIIKK